jgi:hypothetical protein
LAGPIEFGSLPLPPDATRERAEPVDDDAGACRRSGALRCVARSRSWPATTLPLEAGADAELPPPLLLLVTLEPLLPPESPPLRGTATPDRSPPPPWRGEPDSFGELCATRDTETRPMTAIVMALVAAARFMSKLLDGPREARSGSSSNSIAMEYGTKVARFPREIKQIARFPVP